MIGPDTADPEVSVGARGRPLLRGAGRMVGLLTMMVATVVLVLLSVVYAGRTGPGAIDAVLDPLAASSLQNHWFDTHDSYFLRLGDAKRFVALMAVLVLVAALLRYWAAVALLVVGPGIAVAATELVVAPLVASRFFGVLSLPSGHATAVGSAAACVVVLVLGSRRGHPALRWSGAVLVTVVALVSGFAVVAESTHYATDVIAGWCMAVAVVVAAALMIDRVSS